MICPKCPPHNPIVVRHVHYPDWVRLAAMGDRPSRMLLLSWWPGRKPIDRQPPIRA